MERTKFTNTHSYNHYNEPLIVPKQLIELFLKEEYCENLLMLYSFYYYTAKWQGTTIPRSTTEYTSRGLNWGVDKVRRTKKKLIDLGLVEDLTTSDETGKITGHFIKVNLLQIVYTTKTTLLDSHPVVFTQAIKNKEENYKKEIFGPDKMSGTSSIKPKGPSKKERALQYLPLATKLSDIVKSTKNITHTTKQLQNWAYSICQLVEDNKVDIKRVETALDWYSSNIKGSYVPEIESGASLREKFGKLESAMGRTQSGDGSPKVITQDALNYYLQPNGEYRSKGGKLYIE